MSDHMRQQQQNYPYSHGAGGGGGAADGGSGGGYGNHHYHQQQQQQQQYTHYHQDEGGIPISDDHHYVPPHHRGGVDVGEAAGGAGGGLGLAGGVPNGHASGPVDLDGSYSLGTDDDDEVGSYSQRTASTTMNGSLNGRSISLLSEAEDDLDPARLFSILEEALAVPNKQQAAEQQQQQQQNKLDGTGGGGGGVGTDAARAEQNKKRDQAEVTWDRVRRWLWSHPAAEQRQAAAYVRGQADATPLHLMCKLHYPPEEVIAAVVEAAPDTVAWTDTHGWLPLHHACANGASPEVLRLLIAAHPAGKLRQDNQDRTPLHFYATRNSDPAPVMAANAEMLADTGAAELFDKGGMLPMHYACAYGTLPVVLAVLAAAHPDSLTATENKGRTPMHLAMVNAHRDASPAVIGFLLDRASSRSTVNTRDQDGYLPMHLLALGLKGYRADDPDRRQNVGDCLSMYLSAEPRAGADFLTAIQDLPDWLQDTAVVSKHVRNVLNRKIVQRFPTSILMSDGYWLIAIIVCFEMTTRNHIDIRFQTQNGVEPVDENTTFVQLVLVFLGASYFLIRELVQIASLISIGSLSSWAKDVQNWLDMGVIVLVFYYAILMTNPDWGISNETFRSGVAFTKGILWVAVIFFLKSTYIDFAVFVSGVFYVVKRLVAFLMAVGVILLAFAQMFFFVYVTDPICLPANPDGAESECTFPHCTFWNSFLKVYTMMMGEIGDETRYSTSLIAQILYVGYAFLVVILLANVLIAIVTDSYEVVQNDRAAIVFWSNRLDFVAEMDAIKYAVIKRLQRCFRKQKSAPAFFSDDGTTMTPTGTSALVQEGAAAGPPLESHNGGGGGSGAGGGGGGGAGSSVSLHHHQTSSNSQTEYFREGWHQMMQLFDADLYDEIDMLEFWVYNIFRVFCIILIPLWLALGVVTAGWLWPPQVREYLFVQKETAEGRAELERKKLEQLKAIQTDLKVLKQDILREMSNDRDEMVRMRTDVEAVQGEVLADLQQVKELMTSLLGD